MKKNILLYTFLASLFFVGCKKDDGFLPSTISLDRVPLIQILKTTGTPVEIIPSTIGTFTGSITVNPLYPSDKLPEKIDLVIIKNGDKTNVKVLKAGVAVPSVVTFTGAEIQALFGPVVTCDTYTISYDVYANGKKYEAYTAGGVGTGFGGATDANQPGYSVTLNYNTKVEYVPATYSGNFTVVSDAFDDFPAGSTVVLTQVSPTSFSFASPAVSNPRQFALTVDPATLIVTAPKQKIGDFFLWNPAYTNPNIVVTGTTSFVSPCSKTLTVFLNYTVDQGGFGAYKLVLKKP